MDGSSSGFGDESPILFKYPKSFCEVQSGGGNNINLDQLYADLILHLKKSKNITKTDLKSFLGQLNKLKPPDPKNRWLIKKIRGLINYILKKRADFQNAIVKGQIIVYEKMDTERSSLSTSGSEAPTNISLCSGTEDIPVCMLTNNNFLPMDAINEQKVMKQELVPNYSEDLFKTAESLHNYSQENYQLLKVLTQNSVLNENSIQQNETPFAANSNVVEVFQVHETLEDDYKSLISITANSILKNENPNQADTDITMENLESKKMVSQNVEENIFDQFTDNCQELKNEFDHQLEETTKWVSEIISELMKMDIKKKRKPKREPIDSSTSLNQSFTSGKSTELQTYYSEENYKIIRETCLQFKKNLKEKNGC